MSRSIAPTPTGGGAFRRTSAQHAEMHRVRSCGIRGGHSPHGTKRAARRIDGKSKPVRAGRAIDVSSQRPRSNANRARRHVHFADRVPTAHIDDHSVADSAAGHAAPRSARNERNSLRRRESDERREIFDVDRNGHGARTGTRDSRPLRVDRECVLICPERAAKGANPSRHRQSLCEAERGGRLRRLSSLGPAL